MSMTRRGPHRHSGIVILLLTVITTIHRLEMLVVFIFMLAAAVPIGVSAQGNAGNAHACQQGGWQTLARAESETVAFTSEEECVAYGAQGGTIVRATPVNRAPIAVDDAFLAPADAVFPSPASVLANDSDPDGDVLAVTLVSGTSHGAITLFADGTFVYSPAAGFTGIDSFTYRASDGALASNIATGTIQVIGGGD